MDSVFSSFLNFASDCVEQYALTDGQTSLHIAVRWNNADTVTKLMVNGSDVTAPDIEGNTPIHMACICMCTTVSVQNCSHVIKSV